MDSKLTIVRGREAGASLGALGPYKLVRVRDLKNDQDLQGAAALAWFVNEAEAARAVACWNYCRNMTNAELGARRAD